MPSPILYRNFLNKIVFLAIKKVVSEWWKASNLLMNRFYIRTPVFQIGGKFSRVRKIRLLFQFFRFSRYFDIWNYTWIPDLFSFKFTLRSWYFFILLKNRVLCENCSERSRPKIFFSWAAWVSLYIHFLHFFKWLISPATQCIFHWRWIVHQK